MNIPPKRYVHVITADGSRHEYDGDLVDFSTTVAGVLNIKMIEDCRLVGAFAAGWWRHAYSKKVDL